METDRGAVLTVRAAARGIIDFREANLHDSDWWRRYHMLMRELAREDDRELEGRILDYHLALVANSGLTDDSFKIVQTRARDGFFDLMALVRPWEGSTAAQRKQKEIESLRQAYIRAYGDPSDPVWMAEHTRKLEAIMTRWEKDQATETDEERVNRLKREFEVQREEKLRAARKAAERRRQQGR